MNDRPAGAPRSTLHASRPGVRSPLVWLSILYILTGIVYAWATPALEKSDEQAHYGHVLYIREHRALPPFVLPSAQSSVEFNGAHLALTRTDLAYELYQPPLYYAAAALVTSWLPNDPDPDQLLVRNPFIKFSAPAYRNDNRNALLHPPTMTPLVLGARLVSLLFGLGTMVASYFFVVQLLPKNSLVPTATAAIVGFQPTFLFVATAISNDAAIAFFGTLTITILAYRLRKGAQAHYAVGLGVALGMACLTKESGLVFFPLVGLTLLAIHRGFRPAFFREGSTIVIIAVVVSGWWYARNAVLYHDPMLLGAHAAGGENTSVLWNWLKHDLLSIEYTFWANQARTFVSPIAFDQALVWWGRGSLGMLALGAVVSYRAIRSNMSALLVPLTWTLTFLVLLVVYWAPKTSSPYGRFLFPAIAPTIFLLVLGWHLAFPPPWQRLARLVITLSAGGVMVIGILTPWVSLYPLFHPSREWNAKQVEHPVGTVYVDTETRNPIAQLVGYNLPKPYATPGTYFPVELCWEPLGQTTAPYTMFVQLLDLSQMNVNRSPAVWGRRETYPGLGNRPTDRWALHKAFCDPVFVPVFPEAPTPLGAAIEVGFIDPNRQERLQAVDQQGDPVDLATVGGVPILSSQDLPKDNLPPEYFLDDAIGLFHTQVDVRDSFTLTLTWQSYKKVPYDATVFVHLKNWDDGIVLAQVDRQPLDGRFPTSYWLPGQIITDVISLPMPKSKGPLTLNVGMYLWPSMQRLPVKNVSGQPVRDDVIVVDVPQR